MHVLFLLELPDLFLLAYRMDCYMIWILTSLCGPLELQSRFFYVTVPTTSIISLFREQCLWVRIFLLAGSSLHSMILWNNRFMIQSSLWSWMSILRKKSMWRSYHFARYWLSTRYSASSCSCFSSPRTRWPTACPTATAHHHFRVLPSLEIIIIRNCNKLYRTSIKNYISHFHPSTSEMPLHLVVCIWWPNPRESIYRHLSEIKF